jgi:hypothetical protein
MQYNVTYTLSKTFRINKKKTDFFFYIETNSTQIKMKFLLH